MLSNGGWDIPFCHLHVSRPFLQPHIFCSSVYGKLAWLRRDADVLCGRTSLSIDVGITKRGYTNEVRYLAGKTTPAAVKQLLSHQGNLLHRRTGSSLTGSDITNAGIITVVAVKKIKVTGELIIDYGRYCLIPTSI